MVRALLKTFYEKTGTMKDVVNTGDFLLTAYGAASLLLRRGNCRAVDVCRNHSIAIRGIIARAE